MTEQQIQEGLAYADHVLKTGGHLYLDQEYILENFDLTGKKVLDFGCGMGGMTIWLSRQWDCEVVGVDIDHNHIEIAQEMKKKYPDARVRFDRRDVLETPIEEKFDMILINDVVEHIPMEILTRIMGQLRNVLKPGGKLFVSYPPWESPHASHLQEIIPIPWCQFILPKPVLMLWLNKKNKTLVGEKDLKQDYIDLNHLNHKRFMRVLDKNSLSVVKRKSRSALHKYPAFKNVDPSKGILKYSITKEFLELEGA